MSNNDDVETLGKLVAWQIRDMPEAIRNAVVEQARLEEVKVPDLLTRLVLDARAAGWSFAGSNQFANPPNGPDPKRMAAALQMLENLGRSGVPVQKGLAALANRVVKRELQAASEGQLGPLPGAKKADQSVIKADNAEEPLAGATGPLSITKGEI